MSGERRRPGEVQWVTGRRRALARALALSMADARGVRWFDLPVQTRDRLVRSADEVIEDWIADGLLAAFWYEYREAGDPEE